MNYQRIYNQLIENRKKNLIPKDVYSEQHHILPKCLGGSNKKINLVRLTAREHFIAHMLLVEIYRNEPYKYKKMLHAFMIMKGENSLLQERYINSRLYEKYRQEFSIEQSKAQTGKSNSQYGSCWIYHLDKELNKKISKSELQSYLDNGWLKGRVFNFSKKRIELDKIKEQELYIKTRISYFESLWEIYQNHTFKEFVKKTDYNRCHQTLIQGFKKYLGKTKESRQLVWIIKENETTRVHSSKIELYIQQGWKLGRT